MPDPSKETYLGDGLYARFDGSGVWLLAEDPLIPTNRVYLEPEIYEALTKFWGRVHG